MNTKENNIFHFSKGCGVAYLVLYIVIPVLVTAFSLITISPSDKVAEIYCYMSIMISAFNCIYDGANRWDKARTRRNLKIFLILVSNAVIALYCIMEILQMMLLKTVIYASKYVFLVYFLMIFVALYDIFICFWQDMTWKECV